MMTFDAMKKWLAEHNAHLTWSVSIPSMGAISAYAVNKHILIVQVFTDANGKAIGWDAYIRACVSNNKADMLDALNQWCS